MHIEYSDEQVMLRDSIDKYLQGNYSFERRQTVVRAGEGYSREQWQTFAELGWLAMPLPEEHGGFGAGPIETMLMFEAFGRHLVLEPYLETVILTGGLVAVGGSEALQARVLPAIAEGALQGAFAHNEPGRAAALPDDMATTARADGDGYVLSGRKAVVVNGPAADLLLVTARTDDGLGLFAVDAGAAGLSRRDYPTFDGRHASEIELDEVAVGAEAVIGRPGDIGLQIEAVIDKALVALGAEAVGAMDALVAATVQYAGERTQFGQPIGKFQVLQHRMADMYMASELTRSLMLAAAVKLAEGAEDARMLVAALKARIGKAGRFVGQNAIQLHGGIGMTDELSVGHYFKRLTIIENQFGARDYHLGRFSQMRRG